MEQINKIAIKIDKRLVYAFEYLNYEKCIKTEI